MSNDYTHKDNERVERLLDKLNIKELPMYTRWERFMKEQEERECQRGANDV